MSHKHTPAVKRWREKNKAKGLCQCGREIEAERKKKKRSKCQTCADNHRASERKRKFGLDREAHEALLQSQDHQCGICRCEIDQSSHIDHCHETGRVRGILCRSCNTALGIYEKKIRPLKDRIELYLHG